MREVCLTEEVLQQFVDDELSATGAEAAATHIATCAACATALTEVEQESALLMEAFAPEMSMSVPSERLRERLDAAIAELEPQPRTVRSEQTITTGLRAWLASLASSFALTPQRGLAFASIAAVVAFATIFAVIQLRQKRDDQQTVAGNVGEKPAAQSPSAPEAQESPVTPVKTLDAPVEVGNATTQKVARRPASKAIRKPVDVTASNTSTASNRVKEQVPVKATGPQLLPGEKGYIEAIASLTTAIEVSGESLKPTIRADFERNLAVVDQAIASTRIEARRNPKDPYAAEFMYTAYQNKIELLSAVADQTRLPSR